MFPQSSAAGSLQWGRSPREGRRGFKSHSEEPRPPAIALPTSR